MRTTFRTLLGVATLSVIFATSCKNANKNTEETVDTMEESATTETQEVAEIAITPLTDSPAYADAALMLDGPDTITMGAPGEMDFNFRVDNYELGAQTNSPNTNRLANSGKGQHIHFILNNEPYSAHYAPSFKKELPVGTHHLVAFLSRSYHESVKNDNSMIVKKLAIGENPKDSLGLDMKAPTLIYSRPKGTYTGKDTENLLLDFFVLNTELSETGNKVMATINGKEFTITEWVPHVITGLPMGEVNITLKLVDAEGNMIPGPFNMVERKVALKEA